MRFQQLMLPILLIICSVHSARSTVVFDTLLANQLGGIIQIEWHASIEINNDYYTLERSTDSVNYFAIGDVNGVGNSSGITPYFLNDSTASLTQTYYYRVKQTDYSGISSYSDTLKVEPFWPASVNTIGSVLVNLYPNPAQDQVFINWKNTDTANLSILVVDALGKVVKLIENIKTDNITIETSHLPEGLYLLQFVENQQLITTKRIIVN